MYPILFKIGPITIYTYGFFVFLGVLLGYFVCLKEAEKQKIDKNLFSDILFWVIIFSFAGARIFYILVEWKDFLKYPKEIIFNRGGFVFYGGVTAGFISGYFLTKKKKINFLKFADIITLSLPLGHALGRAGCFFYGCCYGRPTDSFIGILFPPDSPAGYLDKKVIPTQLIESFFLLLIFFALIFLKNRKKFDGRISIYYIILYGILRFIIEFFRDDPRGQIFFLSTSQFIAVIFITLGLLLNFKLSRKKSR